MKKYLVEAMIDNEAQFIGVEPHSEIRHDVVGDYTEAETADEAIALALDYIRETVPGADVNDEMMIVDIYRDGKIVEQYYNFTATEVE